MDAPYAGEIPLEAVAIHPHLWTGLPTQPVPDTVRIQ
jgi:hypothetical protein